MQEPDPLQVLAHVDTLRSRTRQDRRLSSVPLLAFGLIILISAAAVGSDHPRSGLIYWLIAQPVGLLGIALWYRRQEVRTGVGTYSRRYTWAAALIVVLCVLVLPVLLFLPLLGIAGVLFVMSRLERDLYLAACSVALGIIGGIENASSLIDTEVSNHLGVTADGYFGPSNVTVGLLGAALLCAGLLARYRER